MKGKVRFIINIYDLENSRSIVFKLTKFSIGVMLAFLSSFIISIIIGFFLSFRFAFIFIENITLKRQNQSLKSYIIQMQKEVELVKSKLDSLFDVTNNFRVIAGLNPIPKDIKYLGIGGYIKNEDSISNLSFETDNLKRLISSELKDVEKVSKIVSEKRDELRRIPSIIPSSGIIISNFGYRTDPFTGEYKLHEGIDIAAPIGTPVYASADGRVIFSGYKEGYGLCIEISHENGIITRYAHLSRSLVSIGQKIKRGEIIGKVGSTGRSTGSHLHYEVIVNGIPRNPMNYIILSNVVYD